MPALGTGNREGTYSRPLTVGIKPSEFKDLELAAEREGVSKAELVRKALASYLRKPASKNPRSKVSR